MRLVLDTNVVASALLWDGIPRILLQAGREKRVNLFISVPLLAELTDILGRSKFEKKIATVVPSGSCTPFYISTTFPLTTPL